MYGKTLTLALLCSLAAPALAAPQARDPANIDAMLQIISEEGARLTQPR